MGRKKVNLTRRRNWLLVVAGCLAADRNCNQLLAEFVRWDGAKLARSDGS